MSVKGISPGDITIKLGVYCFVETNKDHTYFWHKRWNNFYLVANKLGEKTKLQNSAFVFLASN